MRALGGVEGCAEEARWLWWRLQRALLIALSARGLMERSKRLAGSMKPSLRASIRYLLVPGWVWGWVVDGVGERGREGSHGWW